MHGLCQTYNGLKNRFGHNDGTPMYRGSSGCSFRSIWMHPTVCARRSIGSKSFWTHPAVLLGDNGHVKARFGPFGDSANVDAR